MRIGIDIDDTVVNTTDSFFSVMKKYDIDEELYYKEFNNPERLEFLYKYHDEIILNTKLKDNVVEVLNELNSLGHKIYVITARNHEFGKYSISNIFDLIEKYKLPIEEVYYDKPKKYDVCKELNIDLMIDDSEYVCEYLKNNNINYLMFDSLSNKNSNLKRVHNWNEVLEYIKKEGENGENSIK